MSHYSVASTDAAVASTGVLAFFKLIPWPEVAGFCSVVYFTARVVYWIWRLLRGSNKGSI